MSKYISEITIIVINLYCNICNQYLNSGRTLIAKEVSLTPELAGLAKQTYEFIGKCGYMYYSTEKKEGCCLL